MICEKFPINEVSGAHLVRYTYDITPEMPHMEKRPTVVVCPGGAYNICSAREADCVALHYMARGYNAFVLYYSLKEYGVFPTPLLDLCKAMKLIRENASEFGVDKDKIAVLGFSAGGHLAASLGVYWNDPEIMEKSGCFQGENQPNALILVYPVISTSWMKKSGELDRIIGGSHSEEAYKRLNLHTAVSASTPPSFLTHTVRDDAVPVEDSIRFASALIEAGVACELHLFPNGRHGLSLSTPETTLDGGDESFAQWGQLSVNWLNRVFQNREEAHAYLKKAPYISRY